MNSNIETKRALHIQLTQEEANAIYRDLLFMTHRVFLEARTRELMATLEEFLHEEEIYTYEGIQYRKKTPRRAE